MSQDGAVETIGEICEGLKKFVKYNPESAKDLLNSLIEGTLEPLGQDDFFGTEGWEHGLGVS